MTDMEKGLVPTHPGEILREDVLPALKVTKTEFATKLGVSRQTLYDLLGERQPVTVEMALRLGKICGNGPEIWINLQTAYDLATKAPEMADEIGRIPTLEMAD